MTDASFRVLRASAAPVPLSLPGNSRVITVWLLLSGLSIADLVGCRAVGLSFARWTPFLAGSGIIAAVALVYGLSGRSGRIAKIANWILLWIVFSLTGAILTYLAATVGAPWRDAQLAMADAAVGFDWLSWFQFVQQHAAIKLVLAVSYSSLMPQILISVTIFCFCDEDEKNFRLIFNVVLGLLLSTTVFSLTPAVGPWVNYLNAPEANDFYFRDLQLLHDHGVTSFEIPQLKGIICFPSFHTVLAILLTHAHYKSPWFLPFAILNALMLAAIPSEGGHYLVDMVAGAFVSAIVVLGSRFCTAPSRRSLPTSEPMPDAAGLSRNTALYRKLRRKPL